MPKPRGRPVGSTKKTPKKAIEITCAACGELKKQSQFYASYNPIHQTGRIPYCKSCLRKMISDENGIVKLDKLKETLRLIDRPFLYDLWKISMEGKMDTFGCYIKNLQMPQYRYLGWVDSKMLPDMNNELNYDNIEDTDSSFEVTEEIRNRWGQYDSDEYQKLEQFYWDMKARNKIETPQEETYLKKLALISMKMDAELEAGNYTQAKSLGDLFSKYMADSQFRAIDKTDADKTGGLRTFGQIYAEVEKEDFIPPWERYRKIKGLRQDIVDKTIMYIANFILKLNKIETMAEPPADTPEIDKDD
ncbi:MAG: hypothetical protein WDA59_00370 [Methanofastidiosum sp.]